MPCRHGLPFCRICEGDARGLANANYGRALRGEPPIFDNSLGSQYFEIQSNGYSQGLEMKRQLDLFKSRKEDDLRNLVNKPSKKPWEY